MKDKRLLLFSSFCCFGGLQELWMVGSLLLLLLLLLHAIRALVDVSRDSGDCEAAAGVSNSTPETSEESSREEIGSIRKRKVVKNGW